MDPLSIAGILVGLAAVIGGNALDGGHFDALINGPALLIVLGGTLGAILLQTPPRVFAHALRQAGRVFAPPRLPFEHSLQQIIEWAKKARREGLLGLEPVADQQSDPFVRKGIELLVDGNEPEAIRDMLEVELDSHEQRDLLAARVFEGMGGYAPTIGILGAVMGLIHVMRNLADPSMLGSGIATAFVATIYGVALANLFLLPFANKLKTLAQSGARYREMIIEGLVAIAEGENPRAIEIRLRGFLNG